ncbi:MAG: VanZ family protein [Oscillospiraceae bacterium]|nr:VanZ family protein [Oscillospiraceae bacterium]
MCRVLWLSFRHKRHSSVRHEVGLALFVICLIWLEWLTIGYPPWDFSAERFTNFVPFEVVRKSINEWQKTGSSGYFKWNLLGNIAAFMPVGFFMYLLWHVSALNTVLSGLTLSLAIECMQFPIGGRWTDVDDLWLNTLGTALGLLISVALKRIAPKFTAGFKVK